MKFTIPLLFSVVAYSNAKKSVELPSSLAANSKMGMKLLSQARRLENVDDEVDVTWIVDYSIKFQGCHHITQWNAAADGDEDVRIASKRLVRFRLCPSNSCSGDSAGGCDSGYGEYIVDMDTYLEAYLMDLEELHEWNCENAQANLCSCNNDDGNQQDDQFDEQACLNTCYAKYGMNYCVEEEADDAAGEAFELNNYLACAQFQNDGRRLDNNEVEYYIGPYCSEQGGSIYLGMFTDDTCSEFADNYSGVATYKNFVGDTLPYSSSSIVGMECVACEPLGEVEQDDQNQNQNDEVEVKEVCEQLWQTSGKCENSLNINDPNKNGCNYMEGIKMVRKDGIVEVSFSQGSNTVGTFIGLFAVSTCLFGAYTFYLKSKL